VTDREAELRVLLTLAADVECRRLAAVELRDWPRVALHERDIAMLWRRHSELERQAERVA
jgi:hypothetical protein